MASTQSTVEVPASQYESHLPDDFEEDSIELTVVAFDDSVYIKFPRFGRRGTDDICINAEPLFRTLIRVTDHRELSVDPILRKLGVLEDGPFTRSESEITTSTIMDKSATDPAHLRLVEEFTTEIAGFDESDYWNGYMDASFKYSEESVSWPDLAWTCFFDRWNGNRELLLDVGVWLARNGWAVCNRSKALFPIPEWSVPTGSYVASISSVFDGQCPNCGADKNEHWECITSSHRTRVPNKYQCGECGHIKSGITTG